MHIFERIGEKARFHGTASPEELAALRAFSADESFQDLVSGYKVVNGESGRPGTVLVQGWRLLNAREVLDLSSQLRDTLDEDIQSAEVKGAVCIFRTEWKTDIVYVTDGLWSGRVVHIDFQYGRGYEIFPTIGGFLSWLDRVTPLKMSEALIDYRVGMEKGVFFEVLKSMCSAPFDYEDEVESRGFLFQAT